VVKLAMGFLKRKQVSKYTYWYWCERQRRGKRQGGDGLVKSVDLCLGPRLMSPALAFHVWAGDIPMMPLLDGAVGWALSDQSKYITYTLAAIPGQLPALTFRACCHGVDLRAKGWREYLGEIRGFYSSLLECIARVAADLAVARQWQAAAADHDGKLAELRRELETYRADPAREWDPCHRWVNLATGEIELEPVDHFAPRGAEWELDSAVWVSHYAEDHEEKLQAMIDQCDALALSCRAEALAIVDELAALAPTARQRETREKLLREL